MYPPFKEVHPAQWPIPRADGKFWGDSTVSSSHAIPRAAQALSVSAHPDASAPNAAVRRIDLVLIERPSEQTGHELLNGGALHDTRVPIVVLKIECYCAPGAANQNSSPYSEFLCALEKMLVLAQPSSNEPSTFEFTSHQARPVAETSSLDFSELATAYRLTPRERQVLEHVLAGDLNKQTAFRLMISQRTVEHHRAAVMLKMGARTMADLMRIATHSPRLAQ
jgi:DNA-binding CsgD family transcriptional regulator